MTTPAIEPAIEPAIHPIALGPDAEVLYHVADGIATVTMNRPQYHNAQNSKMTYALDEAYRRAASDDAVKVIVLRGAGKHFSAGHDIGTRGATSTSRSSGPRLPRAGEGRNQPISQPASPFVLASSTSHRSSASSSSISISSCRVASSEALAASLT